MKFLNVLQAELIKLRRSKVTWLSFLIYALMVLMAGFFLWIMKNPGLAESLGLLGRKADLTVGGRTADWSTFLGLVLEMDGMGGMIFLAFMVAFVFGREYADGTAKNMLTLPIPRGLFVLAKLVVTAAWFALLSAWLLPLALAVGKALGLASFDPLLLGRIAGELFVASLMAFCLCPLVAWIATATRGYFAPLGYAISTLVLASVFAHTGWGPWVPWSIVGLYTGATGSGPTLAAGSYVVLAATFALGLGLTFRHQALADNVQ
jgi:ABC-2 type transport system permease protein